ncbi:MAG: hypothetical protein KDA61_10140, partial [Planctomycetales bacterium]|nr:hypothetical protein [Planctomycetales bacterium]
MLNFFRLHSLVRITGLAFALVLTAFGSSGRATAQSTVARQWNEALLDAIRVDTPRPTVHARNLYHVSAAMYDAWAAYDNVAQGQFVHEKTSASDVLAARNETIAYAAYGVLTNRYALSVNAATSQAEFNALMSSQGYDSTFTSTVGNSPAALGNRIAQQIVAATLNDGANQSSNYADTTGFTAVNVPMVVGFPTVTDQFKTPLDDPNHWQPLYVSPLTAQNGFVLPSNLQEYIGPNWGGVTPFAMHSSGPYSWSDYDPGAPPQLNGAGHDEYRAQAIDLLRLSHSLDPNQGPGAELINISPAVNGTRALGSYE